MQEEHQPDFTPILALLSLVAVMAAGTLISDHFSSLPPQSNSATSTEQLSP